MKILAFCLIFALCAAPLALAGSRFEVVGVINVLPKDKSIVVLKDTRNGKNMVLRIDQKLPGCPQCRLEVGPNNQVLMVEAGLRKHIPAVVAPVLHATAMPEPDDDLPDQPARGFPAFTEYFDLEAWLDYLAEKDRERAERAILMDNPSERTSTIGNVSDKSEVFRLVNPQAGTTDLLQADDL